MKDGIGRGQHSVISTVPPHYLQRNAKIVGLHKHSYELFYSEPLFSPLGCVIRIYVIYTLHIRGEFWPIVYFISNYENASTKPSSKSYVHRR